jgi:hypothetical protein
MVTMSCTNQATATHLHPKKVSTHGNTNCKHSGSLTDRKTGQTLARIGFPEARAKRPSAKGMTQPEVSGSVGLAERERAEHLRGFARV